MRVGAILNLLVTHSESVIRLYCGAITFRSAWLSKSTRCVLHTVMELSFGSALLGLRNDMSDCWTTFHQQALLPSPAADPAEPEPAALRPGTLHSPHAPTGRADAAVRLRARMGAKVVIFRHDRAARNHSPRPLNSRRLRRLESFIGNRFLRDSIRRSADRTTDWLPARPRSLPCLARRTIHSTHAPCRRVTCCGYLV